MFPYEREAMDGAPMPSGLSLLDQFCFQTLSLIYDRYRRGFITRDQAIMDKKKLIGDRNKRLSEVEFSERLAKKNAILWKNIETAADEWEKTKSREAGEKMYRVIYGLRDDI